jgi:hypothetical protein
VICVRTRIRLPPQEKLEAVSIAALVGASTQSSRRRVGSEELDHVPVLGLLEVLVKQSGDSPNQEEKILWSHRTCFGCIALNNDDFLALGSRFRPFELSAQLSVATRLPLT